MSYQNAKIYFDGGHYIAIPMENFPHGKGRKKQNLIRLKHKRKKRPQRRKNNLKRHSMRAALYRKRNESNI